MINDFIKGFLDIFLNLYNNYLHSHISTLIGYLEEWENHTTIFNDLLSGVYYLCGKPLVIYMVSVFLVIFVIRFLLAIINIVGQYVP